MIILDAEHILGVLMFLAPIALQEDLGHEADVIAEISSSPSEAAMLMTLATMPSGDAWGSRRDPECRRSQDVRHCGPLMLQRWQESVSCRTTTGRFSYWNHGDCMHQDVLTRRQARAYRANLLEVE